MAQGVPALASVPQLWEDGVHVAGSVVCGPSASVGRRACSLAPLLAFYAAACSSLVARRSGKGVEGHTRLVGLASPPVSSLPLQCVPLRVTVSH